MTTPNQIVGKAPGTSAVLQVIFEQGITNVDELLRPPENPDLLSPGFIDLQVNGFAGVDYNDPETKVEPLAASIRRMFSTGVTRFFPTIITGSETRMLDAIRNLARAKAHFLRQQMPEGQAMAGLHIEGPHLSPETGPRGAHPLAHIRPPDLQEFHRWQEAAEGDIRLVTVSPEWEQTPAYITGLVRSGVVASIGHTKASTEQIAAAVDAGATMSTHLGNAAHSTLPKTQNYIWDQLADDRLTASFIVDGIHIPRHFFRSALRAKGLERSVLVTDAVMPALCTPGTYRLGEVVVELLDNGSVVLQDGQRLAGSALRLDHAIARSVGWGHISLREALAMATVNPARVGRIMGRQRGLSPGEKADFVRFRWTENPASLEILETIVAGQQVFFRS